MRKLILLVVALFLLSSAPCRASGFFLNVNAFNPLVVDNGFGFSTVSFVPNNRVFFSNTFVATPPVVVRQQNVVVKEVVREQPVVVKQKTVIRRGLFR